MPERLRLCLSTEDGQARPLLWFRALDRKELFWSPYGLNGNKNPRWTHEWPKQLVTKEPRTEEFRYYLDAAQPRDRVIDHLTSHVDGTFHIKFIDQGPKYTHRLRRTAPLGEDTDVFLEFSLMSDVATAYAPTAKDTTSAVLLPTPVGAGIRLHMAVAGRRCDIFGTFRHADRPQQTIRRFEFGAFAAIAVASPYWPDTQLATNRFPGTFLTFRFPGAGRDQLLNLMLA